MPGKKKKIDEAEASVKPAEIALQPINETIEKNFMPYAMSVIVARAIPEIDGFKPSHRKLLYTMYTMGLLTGARTKSANIVGATMHLNPHGDAAIYDTMVRLTRGNATLLHPFIDSKGSFGKHYSSELVCAASRYTEAKLDPFCAEIFGGINEDAVDFVDNYDGSMKEPRLLPTSFPNILLSPNKGIAVAMSSSICSFNLSELCDACIQLIHNPETTVDQLLDILKAPDFSGGGFIIYNREQMRELYKSGRGSLPLRARYGYNKQDNCIEITEIPYSTTSELIIRKIIQLIKEGKLKEIADVRDETDVSGLRITIDLRRGSDPEKVMGKLFKLTPLQDSFDCNFNVLIDGAPKVLGVGGILNEWLRFRRGCVRRELSYRLGVKEHKLHLLLGLGKLLLDIDKAIKIIRGTAEEKNVVPNLMSGFEIDEEQAEYIAEIKLRHLNREYILNRLNDIEQLQKEIEDLRETVGSDKKIGLYIASQLREIKNKYGRPRQTQLIYDDDIVEIPDEEEHEDFNINVFMTKEGYFKKITAQSLRGGDVQKLKDGDRIVFAEEIPNSTELIFFSNKAQAYKSRVSEFDNTKASELGDYVPAKLGFDEGERVLAGFAVESFDKDWHFVFLFENGKGVRVPVSAYQTKTNRRRLTGAYSETSPAVAVFLEKEPFDLMLVSNVGRAISFNSSLISEKTTRSSQGVQLASLKRGQVIESAFRAGEEGCPDMSGCRKIKLPAALVAVDKFTQITLE